MKRLEEKIKDIVEVRPFSQLHNFAADPTQTLSGYHFTDITSDLMAKWLERIASLTRGVGTATALAGFRGVGKSHFLATVSAILTKPDLRAQISDAHVRSASEALSRRPFHVATVQRGSGESLLDELRTACATATGLDLASFGGTAFEILQQCSLSVGEHAFVILFDTMMGRVSRVSRDDGALLSEIAEAGKSMGMFIGVALDDDISGADGANSSIARSFAIDYLDQEHLFKIVDTHIFAKDGTKLPLLREIYENWRRVLPAFRWSEQRFLSLYPMHPATLEVAPLIRLYIQDFALLGFASEAGVKILGRPANSLIGLDEMFDSIEPKLRQVAELRATFEAFDRIDQSVTAKEPVAKRLPAKLVLKGLCLLSLDGQGASADDIAAGMMIYSDGATKVDVGAVLRSFVTAGAFEAEDGKFRLGSGAAATQSINSLDAAATEVSEQAIWDVLLRLTSEKFSDVEASDDFGQLPTICTVEWRGAIRRGEIVWRHDSIDRGATCDWRILVERRGDAKIDSQHPPTLYWRVSPLTEPEKATLRRCHVLRSDAAVREELGDGFATAVQIHSIAAERIWQRAFIEEAKLIAADAEYPLLGDAAGTHTLAQVLSNALTPYFDKLYPDHPIFGASLGVKEASALVANFFGGSSESSEMQRLAEAFALPLGLARREDALIVPLAAEGLLGLPVIKAAFPEPVTAAVPISAVAERLVARPLGLTREAQHVVLSALVGQRQFDFVTASGNRINHRSLDLQIIWDDIQGIATPQTEEYAVERLLSWAKVLTGDTSLASIDRGEDRKKIVESLKQWLSDWQADNTISKFDALPEEQLNTRVWKLAAGLRRTFGAAASIIESVLSEEITLVECLRSIADLFNDSEPDFERKTEDLAVLNKYVLVSGRRAQMLTYVAAADWTGNDEIDALRRELLGLLIGGGVALNGANDHIDEVWTKYREMYRAHYIERHQDAAELFADGDVLRNAMASERWSAFRSLAGLPFVDRRLLAEAEGVIRALRDGGCTADASAALAERPVCFCGQGLTDLTDAAEAPARLTGILDRAMKDFRTNVARHRDELIRTGRDISPGSNLEVVVDSFVSSKGFPRLSGGDLLLLKRVCQKASSSAADAFDDLLEGDLGAEIEFLALDE